MKHPVVVLLERSEQLFRGMGQEGRGVSRVTEHVGGGGEGRSGTNTRTPFRQDMHQTLFFFLIIENIDFCCFTRDWQLHMENYLWAANNLKYVFDFESKMQEVH